MIKDPTDYDPTDALLVDQNKIDLEKKQAELFYKLDNSNDFTISFALLEFSEFMYQHGFDVAFEVVKDIRNRVHQQRALCMLYEYARNHCTRWESSFDELCVFLIQNWATR